MKLYLHLTLLALLSLLGSCKEKNRIDLSGKWTYQLDQQNIGIDEQWHNQDFSETLQLPGSLATNDIGDKPDSATVWTGDKWGSIYTLPFFTDEAFAKYREPDNFKFPYWLQPKHKYYGAAWYQKTVEVPAAWEGKRIILNLERCHWETEVWINGTYIGLQNKLATPHIYDLGSAIVIGTNKITIKVDNRIKDIDPGINAHSISDHTQSNWNGIIGDISLTAGSPMYIDNIALYPNISDKNVLTTVKISEKGNAKNRKIKLKLNVKNLQTGERLSTITREVEFQRQATINITYPMGDSLQLWDEFTPNLYAMEACIESQNACDVVVENFGMIETKVKDKKIFVNGRESYFRGTLECAIFPKTGFPPTDSKEWIRIFNIIKSFGLNHVRFHSWCPPEAAFDAADQVGLYLQVEANTWSTIGNDKAIDKWIYSETSHIIKTYGNHPSFVIMVHGNEPGGKQHAPYLEKYVSYWKTQNKRLIYGPGSGWPYLDNADVSLPSKPRLQRWAEGNKSIINAQAPQTQFDYAAIVDKYPGAVISHEIGQWCVYPDFSEIEKYTGVLEAKNFEIFQETLNNNGLGALADTFLLASGKLQTLCYKAEIEALLRTQGSSGFQLLDLHDFPGQGTALVGVLNAFWEEKGYVTAKEYRHFCNTVVPLARFAKRSFYDNEKIDIGVELANYSANILPQCTPSWKIKNTQGEVITSGTFEQQDMPIGNGIELGHITTQFPINTLGKYTLEVNVAEFNNAWDFWVYPHQQEKIKSKQVLTTQTLDAKAMATLEQGGKVLLTLPKGSIKAAYGGDIAVGFSSIFWNTAWTSGQAPHTLGILCNPEHEALAAFPTEYHSNWQWWDAMSHSDAIITDSITDQNITPIVRIIDDWVTNRDLALIFEVKVEPGKLLVSGVDLIEDIKNRPEAQQLLYSLRSYMLSEHFDPTTAVEASAINAMIR